MNHTTPITSAAEAEAYIRELYTNGLLFHFDDPLEDIGIFTAEEIPSINKRIDELFEYLADPFDLAVDLVNGEA